MSYPNVDWKFNLISPYDGALLVQRVQEDSAKKKSLPGTVPVPVTDPFKVSDPFNPKTATKDHNAVNDTWVARDPSLIYILRNQTITARPTTEGFGSKYSSTPNVILNPSNP